ncbi:rhodanese-like domain-containing protein [Amaricoccus solimangrovi]|uniref:MBL fold metallo-hydrolase n=1 Tax=Amaricoccus solimangrovi TaxID=2589815 RepID=A0A501WMZ2_9RHOB|nr:rhodanese-like domain-containing protein [Amaricoccus solimangrovi]TPE49710.1 MBL fold metallo-hydrolase [Amaricoccus solimangrovi]
MTLRFEQILADGVAQCSYLVGDDSAGTAAVIDPRPDVDIYLEIARRYGLAITHVFETHIHADFMSGARELAARLDGGAKLCVSAEGGASYDFEHHPLRDGDAFTFGGVRMVTRHTPGHTPEHVSFLLYEGEKEEPWGVLTGDSFFVDSVGRPDLLGEEETEELTEALFRTTRDFYMKLPDPVIIYPGHGAGSACGPNIGDRMSSTIGYERAHNSYAAITEFDAFRRAMHEDAPPVPTHYPRLKKVNAAGPEVLGNLPRVPALPPAAFADSLGGDAQLLDVRDMLSFGGGHIPGALNIGARPELSVWAGWLLDPDRPIHLVLEDDRQLPEVLRLLWRTGFTRFGGYLAGGMGAWRESGRDLRHIPQLSVHELRESGVATLDVRKDGEWRGGHVPGARHIFLGELRDRLGELDPAAEIATYCASGFRASMAASILAAHGFAKVRNVPGSWKAWKAAGYETEKPSEQEKQLMRDVVKIDDRFTVAKFAPAPDALRAAAKEGFRSVVNMRTSEEKQEVTPEEERGVAEAAGLTYMHHPVDGQNLSEEVVDGFREKVGDLPGPILVHCASGKRSGALVMMHRGAQRGMSGDEVIEKAESMGFECDTPGLKDFVRGYLDKHTH